MVQTYILGGYTRRVNDGLYSITFNSDNGLFKNKQLIAHLNSPTYVALTPDNKTLFAIHSEDDMGGIVVFRRQEDYTWEELTRKLIKGPAGCHVSYREQSQTIYVSNYHAGTIDVFKLDKDELDHIQQITHTGSSIHPNQQSSHIHFAGLNNTQDLLFVCDLGTDSVSTYSINEDGYLTLNDELKMPAGTGPRHLVLNNENTRAYVNGELDSTVHLLDVSSTGKLKLTKSYTNIAKEKVESSASAAIRLSKDNKFLYVSSRFHNGLTVYSVNSENGHLTKIQFMDSVGQIPRDFILDKTEKYVLVPHQDSDHISVFKRDESTGKLNFLNNETYAPECVCIAPSSHF